MFNTKCVLTVVFFSIINVANGQNCDSYAGTKTLYPSVSGYAFNIPTDYKPVFINYVGRHGARHLTKDVSSSFIYNVLQQANDLHQLSLNGERLYGMVRKLDTIEQGHIKSISRSGEQELQLIASRMKYRFPTLLNKMVFDSIMVTKEKRTTQSAKAFLSALAPNASPIFYINDTILRFFDFSPSYLSFEEKGNWIQAMEKADFFYQDQKQVSAVASQFFIKGHAFNSTNDAKQFISDLFGFVVIVPSIAGEMKAMGFRNADVNFSSFFTCKQLTALGKNDNLEDYLLKGPGFSNSGIQVRIAAPLAADFIKTTDRYIQTGSKPLQLRFTHAEAIAPFAALLGIHDTPVSTKNIKQFDADWKADEIIPLSANIQEVLYEKSGKFYIMIMLNEMPVKLKGLSTTQFPLYSWDEFKTVILKKLQHFGLSHDTNYFQYLQQLK